MKEMKMYRKILKNRAMRVLKLCIIIKTQTERGPSKYVSMYVSVCVHAHVQAHERK